MELRWREVIFYKNAQRTSNFRCAFLILFGCILDAKFVDAKFVTVSPHCFDDARPQLTPELIDHAGDPRPTGVIGVRSDSLVDLAGREHLPWPAGQQEQNIKLHRRQVYRMAGLQNQPALRGDLQRAKEQRCVCGGGHRGEVCDRSKGRHSVRKDGILAVTEG